MPGHGLRTAAAWRALAVAFGSGLPIAGAEAKIGPLPSVLALRFEPPAVSDPLRPGGGGTSSCRPAPEDWDAFFASSPGGGEPWATKTEGAATDAPPTEPDIGSPPDDLAAAAPQGADAKLEHSLREPAVLEKVGASDPGRPLPELTTERRWFVGVDPGVVRGLDRPTARPGVLPAIGERDAAPGGPATFQLAQFQLPPIEPDMRDRPPRPVVQQLTYQYSYGSESSIVYRRDSDLNKAVQDNILLITPQINGLIVYRPTNWLVATLEMLADVEIPAQQPETIRLPNGQVIGDVPTRSSLIVDQGFVTIRGITAPFEFSLGRRNYEDERHWLYDTSLDILSASFRQGAFRAEAFTGREVFVNLNLMPNQVFVKDRINTSLLYLDYRGIPDIRLAAYTIVRSDLTRNLGRPQLNGVRAIGRPTDDFNFWTELAYLSGKDAAGKQFAGRGFDVGFTYRFTGAPLNPNITLGYAYGSGDDNPNDARNHTFQQTGLESNESRFAGIAKFKYYGEVLEPQLSNIKIFTLGVGAYPAPNISVDLVYHKYRLAKIADEVAGSPITALMAQFDPLLSKKVGTELDLVFGFRQLFGIRRLGMDLRMGWFSPGKAFIRNDGDDENPILRKADKGFTVVAKFWW